VPRKFHYLLLTVVLFLNKLPAAQPLSLHPENPHYFLFRQKPTLIVTSGEHYGAVLNLDFDFEKYSATLAADGLNGTRTWAGPYCEPPGAFNIASNSLAPLSGRFICPWARSDQPGYPNGGNKFDLTRWDEAYFKRLNAFMKAAGEKGIIVELNLFCPFYEESMWKLSPMNASNNINDVGAVLRTNVYTLDKHGGLLAIQEAVVRKLVRELKDYDNLYYEICNEPYFGGVTLEWQHHIADVIIKTEQELGTRHLISRNVANGSAQITNPHPGISIFNFHYASPAETVGMNYRLNKLIGDNETGFRGTNDAPYRMEAWDFLAAGGGLFNNLDFSFVAGKEDGTFQYPDSQPAGGSPSLRRQLHSLQSFISDFDYLHMEPRKDLIQGNLPAEVSARILAVEGKQYFIYFRTPARKTSGGQCEHNSFGEHELTFSLELRQATFEAKWFDPAHGQVLEQKKITHPSGPLKLMAPAFEDDIALALRRVE
jgi:hypothetical protein